MAPKNQRWWLTEDSVELDIEADADVLYEMVSDLPRIGEWSPECEGVEAGFGSLHRGAHDLEVGSLAPLEEGVVDAHERVEVLVDRRGLHAEPAGDLREAEPVDALLGHHVIRDGEDLLDGLLAPPCPTIG